MQNRLESLRREVYERGLCAPHEKICVLSAHICGVSKFCALLAMKRGLNAEIAAACGLLHDIYNTVDINSDNHAVLGAEFARGMLIASGAYSADEIELITTAISRHSEKRHVHTPYDELLKDADVLDHCFCNTGFPIAEWEKERYADLLAELGINADENR